MHPENITQPNWQKALEAANSHKRCGAKTRSHKTSMSPAMLNGRCRMYGGKSTGVPRGDYTDISSMGLIYNLLNQFLVCHKSNLLVVFLFLGLS